MALRSVLAHFAPSIPAGKCIFRLHSSAVAPFQPQNLPWHWVMHWKWGCCVEGVHIWAIMAVEEIDLMLHDLLGFVLLHILGSISTGVYYRAVENHLGQ